MGSFCGSCCDLGNLKGNSVVEDVSACVSGFESSGGSDCSVRGVDVPVIFSEPGYTELGAGEVE